MSKTAVTVAGLLVLAAGISAGWAIRDWLSPAAVDPEAEASAEVSPGEMAVHVAVAPAEVGDLPLTLSAVGRVQAVPSASITLSSRAGGRILDLHVQPGDFVEEGQAILDLDPVPLEASAARARAESVAADNRLEEYERYGRQQQSRALEAASRAASAQRLLADAEVTRLESLAKSGLVSDKALAEARKAAEDAVREETLAAQSLAAFESEGAALQLSTLRSAADSAHASLREAEANLADATVASPAAGQIIELPVRKGDRVEAGAPLGALLRRDGRVLSFPVGAAQAGRIQVGARVTWRGSQGAEHVGRVTRIQGEVDAVTGLVALRVEADDGGFSDPPGLVVRGSIEAGRLKDVILVPEAAIVRSSDRLGVVVAGDDGLAHVTAVEVLGRHGGLAAIEGEVRAGDRIVVDGAYNLPDGARIITAPLTSGDRR